MNPCQAAPLRGCLLSGGASRRMGRDKALLPHPEGGTWLVRTLRLLLELEIPVTLCSRHERHLQLARELHGEGDSGAIEALAEPPPWEGPLLALHRLMERHPEQRLLLCPVDMPWLTLEALRELVAASDADPLAIQLADDGERLQPLLGVYPSQARMRQHLAETIANGERRLQTWLAAQPCRRVRLNARALRNVNRPREWLPD